MTRTLLASTALIIATACKGDNTIPALSVRDSAGVEIITSGPLWGAGEGWRVGPEPILTIGEEENDSTSQFQRVVGIARVSDDRIVIADGGSNTIRAFDRQGGLAGTYGRPGRGPGEFRAWQSLESDYGSWARRVYMWGTWDRVVDLGSFSQANQDIDEIGVYAVSGIDGVPYYYEWDEKEDENEVAVQVLIDREFTVPSLRYDQSADHEFLADGTRFTASSSAPTLWYSSYYY